MKYSVVFSSKTGNTQQLANAITSLLPESDLIYFGPPSECALQADRFYIGFWTDKGHCNAEIADFLKHLKGKDIFLFGTADFGGSAGGLRPLWIRMGLLHMNSPIDTRITAN